MELAGHGNSEGRASSVKCQQGERGGTVLTGAWCTPLTGQKRADVSLRPEEDADPLPEESSQTEALRPAALGQGRRARHTGRWPSAASAGMDLTRRTPAACERQPCPVRRRPPHRSCRTNPVPLTFPLNLLPNNMAT